ncbi:DNA-directed RNA polymerases II, IV and V subunit 9A-like [Dendrobium catenatum]|uniref:DNA-directed RNA polymerases II, IV and V subunit 9A-like n=1 Tax=Dendrobium catenatum TaxID=906689 RepID=UPI0010A066D8|nr:DNA-directed RNA polymerases II, IV and V subunit 9A-like [Dendrobium catenatum]
MGRSRIFGSVDLYHFFAESSGPRDIRKVRGKQLHAAKFFYPTLLYPKEDKKRKILLSACRTCSYTEVAESNRVYRNEITQTTERPQSFRAAYADPTVPREKELKCPVCNHPHVAFFLH